MPSSCPAWKKASQIGKGLMGFDTPETFYAKCASERELGDKATARLIELLQPPAAVVMQDSGRTDRYRRGLGTLTVDGRNVGEILIQEGLAVPYNGRGQRRDWC